MDSLKSSWRQWAAAALALSLLAGCATIKEVAASPETFAVCKAADVATTAIALSSGHFVEANPLAKVLLAHGYFPLIAVSVGMYLIIKHYNDERLTMAANAVTCPIAAHNLFLLVR